MDLIGWLNRVPPLLLLLSILLFWGQALFNRALPKFSSRLFYGFFLVSPLFIGFFFAPLERHSLIIAVLRLLSYAGGLYMGRHYFLDMARLKSFKGSIDLILLLGGGVIAVTISACETLFLLLDRYMPHSLSLPSFLGV